MWSLVCISNVLNLHGNPEKFARQEASHYVVIRNLRLDKNTSTVVLLNDPNHTVPLLLSASTPPSPSYQLTVVA